MQGLPSREECGRLHRIDWVCPMLSLQRTFPLCTVALDCSMKCPMCLRLESGPSPVREPSRQSLHCTELGSWPDPSSITLWTTESDAYILTHSLTDSRLEIWHYHLIMTHHVWIEFSNMSPDKNLFIRLTFSLTRSKSWKRESTPNFFSFPCFLLGICWSERERERV